MAPVYKVALIQLHPKILDPDQNFSRASSFIRSAAGQGAELAVLPEYHLTSWTPRSPRFSEQARLWQQYLSGYQDLAQELKICIVPGTIVEAHVDEKTGEEKLLNVAYFISDTGKILGRYEKKNLWHPERPYLTSSTHDPHEAFDTPLGKVGMLVCWDLAFPEAFRELIAQGAQIVIVPTFWGRDDSSDYGLKKNPKCELLFLESMITARAYENTCAVVFVNAGASQGNTGDGTYAGMSRVSVPFVGALGKETMDTSEEGMSLVDIDMEILEEAEKNYRVRTDLAKEAWHYSYRHQTRL